MLTEMMLCAGILTTLGLSYLAGTKTQRENKRRNKERDWEAEVYEKQQEKKRIIQEQRAHNQLIQDVLDIVKPVSNPESDGLYEIFMNLDKILEEKGITLNCDFSGYFE